MADDHVALHDDCPAEKVQKVDTKQSTECVLLDHNTYSRSLSPSKVQRELEKKDEKIAGLRKKLKCKQQNNRRLKKCVQSFKTIIKVLKDKHLISSGCEEILSQSFSGASLEILKRASSARTFRGKNCPAEFRSFAMTLQFYSAKAYEFVRKSFNLALPHQAQIRKWYGKVPAEPRFTKPAFQAFRASVISANEKGQQADILSC